MGRENKKAAVAALHRSQILKAAEALFLELGYKQSTIADISARAGYSRRTIYAYFESKDAILFHLIEQGLQKLKADVESALSGNAEYVVKYEKSCRAIAKYRKNYPYAASIVSLTGNKKIKPSKDLAVVERTVKLGNEINDLFVDFVKDGQENGIVRKEVDPVISVYIMSGSITYMMNLAQENASFISKEFHVTKDQFLTYGFRMILNSILVNPV